MHSVGDSGSCDLHIMRCFLHYAMLWLGVYRRVRFSISTLGLCLLQCGILWHRYCGSIHCLHCLSDCLLRLHIGNCLLSVLQWLLP